MAKLRALIVGAGIGGLTAAIALLRQGDQVDIFEQSCEIKEIGAGLQLGPNAMKVLSAFELKPQIIAAAFEPGFAAFRHFKSGKIELHVPMKQAYEQRYGEKYLHIHRADLHRILLSAAKDLGANIHLGAPVKSYTQGADSIDVQLEDRYIKGDLLIGADGIHSSIQAQMIGAQKPRFTRQTAWRGTVPTSSLPSGTLAPGANNWMGPGRHFVSYYIRGGDVINFVAVKERNEWTEESWQTPGDMDELRESFAGWDAPVTQILKACETCYLWGLFDRDPLIKWTDGRAALLGDSAHPMLPFAAQGAAMAIEDGWVLASCLAKMKDVSFALAAYEAARKPRTAMIQAVSRRNAVLYHHSRHFALFKRRLTFGIGTYVKAAQNYRLDPIFGVNVVEDYPV